MVLVIISVFRLLFLWERAMPAMIFFENQKNRGHGPLPQGYFGPQGYFSPQGL
jgi:hypothetical protein